MIKLVLAIFITLFQVGRTQEFQLIQEPSRADPPLFQFKNKTLNALVTSVNFLRVPSLEVDELIFFKKTKNLPKSYYRAKKACQSLSRESETWSLPTLEQIKSIDQTINLNLQKFNTLKKWELFFGGIKDIAKREIANISYFWTSEESGRLNAIAYQSIDGSYITTKKNFVSHYFCIYEK